MIWVLTIILFVGAFPCCSGEHRDDLIAHYFREGYTYLEIVVTLLTAHGIKLCTRQLKRILSRLHLKRRVLGGKESDIDLIGRAIDRQLQHSGECLGYRAMWRRIRQEDPDLRVKQKTVRELIKILDPEGVERRKRHRLIRRKYITPGPDFLWHADGYDKLKPYGFAIHGAIDGYSRRVLWLHVSPTNNDPAVIAHYYLNYLEEHLNAPRILRCDLGTENTTIELLQSFFRHNCNDEFAGVKSFIYGKSTANQRVEAWWSLLRKSCVDWWIGFFKDIRDRGLYIGHDPIHVQCLRYCFMGILRAELQRTAEEWNSHPIRKNKNGECPAGRPNVIYFSPELYDSDNFGTSVHIADLQICKDEYSSPPPPDCTVEFLELLHLLKPFVDRPTTVDAGFDLYVELINELEQY